MVLLSHLVLLGGAVVLPSFWGALLSPHGRGGHPSPPCGVALLPSSSSSSSSSFFRGPSQMTLWICLFCRSGRRSTTTKAEEERRQHDPQKVEGRRMLHNNEGRVKAAPPTRRKKVGRVLPSPPCRRGCFSSSPPFWVALLPALSPLWRCCFPILLPLRGAACFLLILYVMFSFEFPVQISRKQPQKRKPDQA